jgi:fibronectin-binding autotransporter adhesin
MKNQTFGLLIILLFAGLFANAQTSWKGTSSSSWSLSSNWTAGVPSSTVDAVIGDASFTGSFQPTVSSTSTCKSLTLGNATKASTLTVGASLTVSGGILIGANGTLTHTANNLSLKGNWTKAGTYNPGTGTTSTIIFAGSSQGINSVTAFRHLTINSGSTTTLNANISVAGAFTVKGIFDPNDPSYLATLSGTFVASAAGTVRIRTALLSGNYSINPTTIDPTSIIDYASSTTNQTIAALSYGSLRISGALVKTPAANITMQSSPNSAGKVTIAAGTLDLTSFTMNRAGNGGTFTISSGATLKIGGTNTFPSNYSTRSIATTSTVEYNGTAQTVSSQSYGNLILSSGSGSVVKTMPGSAMTIANDFTTTIGSGTGVSLTAGAAITVNGNISIGASTSFDAGSFSHSFSGNIANNGTFTGSTSTVTFKGTNKVISGSSAYGFNNLTITGLGTTASATTINVSGNLTTSGSGTFVHNTGGTLTMSGTSKTITGTGSTFDNLTLTGTISTANSSVITGNLVVNGSLSATAGTINMNGTGKTISGSGSIIFFALRIPATVSTTNSFSMRSDFSGLGKFTATAGTATFIGTSTFSGTHDFYNVTLNGTKLQLGTNSIMGVANALTLTSGSFNVTTSIPNTVNYNGSGAQNIAATTYNNLSTSTSGTKTALGNTTINNALTIGSGTTFAASTYIFTIGGNWINNGSFSEGTSTVRLSGTTNSTITGTTTFSTLQFTKSASTNYVTLNSSITVPTLTMTTGDMRTGSNSVTVTSSRTGNGIILGTITRTHAFSASTAYAFEGPNNTITFTSITGTVSSVSVTVTAASVSDFPLNGSVNRVYNISVTNSGSYVSTLRLHYLDAELNGNTESSMSLWRYISSTWTSMSKSSNDATNNWVQQVSLTDISNRWTLSDNSAIGIWKGGTSSAWATASNWKSGSVPTSADIIQIGTESFTNQPTITTSITTKALVLGSVQASTLTIGSGGSLTVNGNVVGDWLANVTNTIAIGNQTMTIAGDMVLSNGNAARNINVTIGTGTLNVTGSLTEAGNAGITFSGAGNINIGSDYNYTGGTFTPSSGTITFNGTASQAVAGGITYNNLTINKSAGTATIASAISLNGNLTLSSNSVLDVNATLTIAGNLTINSSATLNENGGDINIGGNFSGTGPFNADLGIVTFNGTGSQTVVATTFNDLVINKASGTITPTGNLTVNGDLTITAGTLDLVTYTADRSVVGGTLTMGSTAYLKVGAASNFPTNYNVKTISAASTVEYYGTMAQNIGAIDYGNLILSNGGATHKVLTGATTVNGNCTISSGASLNSADYTLTLMGNFTNSGTFTPTTGSVVLAGTSKTVTGSTHFNDLIITGSYSSAASTNFTIDGLVDLSGSYVVGSNNISVGGDAIISGTYSSDGTTTYTGTQLQTIRFTGTILSPTLASTNTFAGTIAPILNSTATPNFVNVNISNTGTGGIAASVGWVVVGTFNISSGCTFDGGANTHNFYGPFTNNGTVLSEGILNFSPIAPYVPSASATYALGSGAAFASTGTVIFAGIKQLIITGAPTSFNNVIISNINSAGISPVSNWTITGDLSINNSATLNGGSYSHSVAGNLESDGTLDGGTSTFTMSSATGLINGSPNTTFYNLVISGNITANSNFNISHNLTNNGSLDASIGTIVMTGSTAGVIDGTASPFNLAQVDILKTSNASVTLAKSIAAVAELNIASGILDASTYSITQLGSSGLLSVSDNAKLSVGGTNSLPVFNSYTMDTLSTIEYNGNTQAISSAITYGNLTISSSGTKTATAALKMLGNFSLSNGTFVPGNFSDTLLGNWSMTSGSFTNTGNTIVLAGTGTQDISSTGSFNDLTINKASGQTNLLSSMTIDGVLSLTNGTLAIGSNTLSLSGSPLSIGTGVLSATSASSIAVGGSNAGPFSLPSNITALNNLTINNANGTPATVNAMGDLAISGTLALTSGTLAIAAAKTLSITGSHTNGSGFIKGAVDGTTLAASLPSLSLSGVGGTFNNLVFTAGNREFNNLTFSRSASITSTAANGLHINGVVTVTGASSTLTTGGSLTLRSSINGTARVANLTGITNAFSGNVTVERYLSALSNRAYRLLTSTVTTATSMNANWQEGKTNTSASVNIPSDVAGYGTHITGTGGSTNGFDQTVNNAASVYTFNQATTAWQALTSTSATLNAKTAYLVYIRGNRDNLNVLQSATPSSDATIRATGTLLQGTQTFTGLANAGNLSLVTNPYPSPIRWDASSNGIYNIAGNTTNFENYITIWDPNVGTRGGYITIDVDNIQGGGSTNLTNEIQSGQAFFIQTKTGISNPTLTVQENHKSVTNNLDVFRTGIQTEVLKTFLFFTDNNGIRRSSDGVTSVFNNNYSSLVDGNDAEQMANWDEDVAILREAKQLSVERRPLADGADTIQLVVARLKQQTYQWQFQPSNFNAPDLQAFLEDNFTNTITEIKLNDTTIVSFSVTSNTASSASNRFRIIMKPIATIVWTGNKDSNWLDTANWNTGTIPDATKNITIANTANAPSLNSTQLVKRMVVNNTASITVQAGATLKVAGHFTNNGKITGLGSLMLIGTTAQQVDGKGSISNLTLANNAGITITAGAENMLSVTGILTAMTGLLTTNGNLTLKSTSIENTATLAAIDGSINTGSIDGKVTVERFIPAGKRGFRFISPSVTSIGSIKANWQEGSTSATDDPMPGYGTHITGSSIDQLNGFDATASGAASLFLFDNATQQWNTGISNTDINNLMAGNAYRVFIRGNRSTNLSAPASPSTTATVLRSTGTLVTGQVQFKSDAPSTAGMPLLSTDAEGFSFIGNPYASTIDWSALTKNGITNYYYAWDPTLGARGAYVSCYIDGTKSNASSAITTAIQPGQGFFVQNKASLLSAPSLTIEESHKSGALTNMFRTATADANIQVQLYLTSNLANGVSQDGTTVLFNSNYSTMMNDDDAMKMLNPDENIAIQKGNNHLSIERRALPTLQTDTVWLKTWQMGSNNYSLKLDAANFPATHNAYLQDTYLNTETLLNLSGSTVVPFTSNAGQPTNRFRIVFRALAALPVMLTEIKAHQENQGIAVKWATQQEMNMASYELEKSADGILFSKTATITAKNGSSNNYSWFDAQAFTGNNFYRLKMIDKSGSQTYSKVVKVNISNAAPTVDIYPNPVKGSIINLQLSNLQKGTYTVTISNKEGQEVWRKQLQHNGGSASQTIDMGASISSGSYQLTITDGLQKLTQHLIKL